MAKTQLIKIFLLVVGILMISATGYEARRMYEDIKKNVLEINRSFIVQRTQKEIVSSTQRELKENIDGPTRSGIDISEWKTYRNEDYRFEIKYPPRLILAIEHSRYDDPASPIGIFLTPNINERQGLYIFPKGEFDYGIGEATIKEGDVLIGDRIARKMEYIIPKTEELRMVIIRFKDLADFRIELHPSSACTLDILNKILSTFEFF